ncbi:hypothetical protein [Hufsiella ginkgonis]|uniref:Uncharacterized protein n=1 Tax=Hufsiella ginkgonis TaxID=2695274 RepID=A0A7K1Y209_9SPHI|nr:hypothetical protein [Hufsiella ginkgonis]MXV17275.1 hypothetical protein [Hufsiella ginkgonis]
MLKAQALLSRKTMLHPAYRIVVTPVFLFEWSYLVKKAGPPHFIGCPVLPAMLPVSASYLDIHWLMPGYLLTKKCVAVLFFVVARIIPRMMSDVYPHVSIDIRAAALTSRIENNRLDFRDGNEKGGIGLTGFPSP